MDGSLTPEAYNEFAGALREELAKKVADPALASQSFERIMEPALIAGMTQFLLQPIEGDSNDLRALAYASISDANGNIRDDFRRVLEALSASLKNRLVIMVPENQPYETIKGLEKNFVPADNVKSLKAKIAKGKTLVCIALPTTAEYIQFAQQTKGEVKTTIFADKEFTGPVILYGLFAGARLANGLPIVAINPSAAFYNALQTAFPGAVRLIPRTWEALKQLALSIKALSSAA